MRISELSTTSGVPLPSIKYYLREGLLPRGELSGPNQATYGETHLKRLRLIRALLEVGGISVAAAKTVIDAIDSDLPVEQTFGIAQHAVSEAVDPASLAADSLARVDEVLDGWHVSPDNPGRLAAARALTAFRAAGQPELRGWVQRYADAALLVAAADLDEVDARNGRQEKAELVVVGTALGDALLSGLRRAAQEHVSAERYFAASGGAQRTDSAASAPESPAPTRAVQ